MTLDFLEVDWIRFRLETKKREKGGGLRVVRTGKSAVCSHVTVTPEVRTVTMSQTGTKIQSLTSGLRMS